MAIQPKLHEICCTQLVGENHGKRRLCPGVWNLSIIMHSFTQLFCRRYINMINQFGCASSHPLWPSIFDFIRFLFQFFSLWILIIHDYPKYIREYIPLWSSTKGGVWNSVSTQDQQLRTVGRAADVVILLLVLLCLTPGDVVRKAITVEGNPGENAPGHNCFTVVPWYEGEDNVCACILYGFYTMVESCFIIVSYNYTKPPITQPSGAMGTKQWTVLKRLILPSLQPRLWMPVPRNPHQSKNVMAPSSPRRDSLCRRFDGGRSKELRMLMGETKPKTVAREAAKHWLTWWTSHRLGIAQHCMIPFGRTPAGRSDWMCVCVMWIV